MANYSPWLLNLEFINAYAWTSTWHMVMKEGCKFFMSNPSYCFVGRKDQCDVSRFVGLMLCLIVMKT